MSATASTARFTVTDAIQLAFDKFGEFYEQRPDGVLLEGVLYDEEADVWRIAIGFDSGSEEVVTDRPLLDLPERTFKRRAREAREFVLDGDTGAFLEMRRLPE